MAHLAIVGRHSVNGVAALHTELVKSDLLPDFDELWPERFNNKTNGVTPRRWLLYANPRLTRLITQPHRPGLDRPARAGTPGGAADVRRRRGLPRRAARGQAGEQARRRGAGARTARASSCSADAMFVVQIKRIHEYKRQLLACLQIVAHYLALKRDPAPATRPARLPLRGQGGARLRRWPSCTSG